jgi:hypothetical protein
VNRLAACLLVLLAACHATVPSTVPGTLTVHLVSAGTNDGAMVLVVSGGEVQSVETVGSYEVTSNTDEAGMHVMVVGNLAVGALVRLHVPDVSRASAYIAVIGQVADRTNFGLVDATGYRVTVDEVP